MNFSSFRTLASPKPGQYSTLATPPLALEKHPAIVARPELGESAIYLGFVNKGTPGGEYRIEYSTDLTLDTWTHVDTVTLTKSEQLWVDTTAFHQAKRFFRAVVAL